MAALGQAQTPRMLGRDLAGTRTRLPSQRAWGVHESPPAGASQLCWQVEAGVGLGAIASGLAQRRGQGDEGWKCHCSPGPHLRALLQGLAFTERSQ